MASFQNLPTELALDIFSYLDYITLIKLSQTCRFFNTIITTANSGQLGITLLRYSKPTSAVTLNDNLDPSSNENDPDPSSFSSFSLTKEKYHCFELHPCLRALSIDFSKSTPGGNKNEGLFGFFNKTTNDFIPLSQYSILPHEKLFYNDSIPITDLNELLSRRESDKRYLITSATKKDIENITIAEFVAGVSKHMFSLRCMYSIDSIGPAGRDGKNGVLQVLHGFKVVSVKKEGVHLSERRVHHGVIAREAGRVLLVKP